jgi:hypothetical protein
VPSRVKVPMCISYMTWPWIVAPCQAIAVAESRGIDHRRRPVRPSGWKRDAGQENCRRHPDGNGGGCRLAFWGPGGKVTPASGSSGATTLVSRTTSTLCRGAQARKCVRPWETTSAPTG